MVRLLPDHIVRPGRGGIVQRAPLAQASETFTAADGTAITALTPPWTKHAVAATNTAAPVVNGGRVHGENAASVSVYYRNDWVPAGADYDVFCDVVLLSDNNTSEVGPVGRALTAANTMYMARYNAISNVWQLFKFVNGTATQLGSNVDQTLTVSQAYATTLSMRGSAIALFVDGVPIVAVTDADVTAPGRAGIRLQNAATSSTGLHLDNWGVRQ